MVRVGLFYVRRPDGNLGSKNRACPARAGDSRGGRKKRRQMPAGGYARAGCLFNAGGIC
jgi:hypothetical protein